MNVIEVIKKKRDKVELSREEINFIVLSFTKNKIPDYQFSAFLMAAFINGMTVAETACLTEAMLYSGKVIDLSAIKGIKVDKHSTGGIGDKTSLIIAPIAAAAGVPVPMISGRGLGHTGGTLDKLESIPGFRTDLSLSEYKNAVKKCGVVLIGQTKEIAPADKVIYSLRDVTGTVESIPLITASIMSKKLAEGIDGLVLDIKTGSGAFMKSMKDAEILANSLINTAKAFKKEVIGFITDMNQPLGNYIGNWFEVYESVQVLKGEAKGDLYELCLSLAGAMIYLGKKASSIEEGIEMSKAMINNGKAYNKFVELVKIQHGKIDVIENANKYPKSKFSETIYCKGGFLGGVDNLGIGMAALELGAGRMTKEDIIDHKAGIIFRKKIGDECKKGDVIAELYSDSKIKLAAGKERLLRAVEYSDKKIKGPKLIKKVIR